MNIQVILKQIDERYSNDRVQNQDCRERYIVLNCPQGESIIPAIRRKFGLPRTETHSGRRQNQTHNYLLKTKKFGFSKSILLSLLNVVGCRVVRDTISKWYYTNVIYIRILQPSNLFHSRFPQHHQQQRDDNDFCIVVTYTCIITVSL